MKLLTDINSEQTSLGLKDRIEQNGNNLILKSSDSLDLGIINGDFNIADPTADDFGWNLTGTAFVVSGRGVLAEGSAFFSSINQTFKIPENIKTLQFTLVDSDFGDSFFAPDALEIALLDANTSASLAGTHSLGETDAFFNLQNDGLSSNSGTVSFSDRVKIGGTTSGNSINLDNYHTVSVDISHLSAGTEAVLYFDLLSFGAVDSRVSIDNILLTENAIAVPFEFSPTLGILVIFVMALLNKKWIK